MKNVKEKQNIPDGWRVQTLGEIASITNGSTNTQDAVSDGDYPLFDRSVDVKKSNKYLFDDAAIILPGEGADFVPKYYKGKFDLHQRAYAIFPRESINASYLYQYLYANRGEFLKKSVGSTVRSLRLPIIQSVHVNVPPLKEQQKIAEILGAVDEDIAKTKEVIRVTEKLKRGLMQQLFTRGIGHTKFKQTEIGEVPEEWGVLSLQEMLDTGVVTSHLDGNHGELYPKATEFVDRGVSYLSANCIEDGVINFGKAKYLTSERAAKFLKGVALDGDILFAHNATVGPVTMLETNEPYVILSTTLTYYRCNREKLVPAYLRFFMESPLFVNQYEKVMTQTTRNQVPITMQRKFKHLLPPLTEQEEIADILMSFYEKIMVNKKLLAKVTELKKGLMQELLNGRVRTII